MQAGHACTAVRAAGQQKTLQVGECCLTRLPDACIGHIKHLRKASLQ